MGHSSRRFLLLRTAFLCLDQVQCVESCLINIKQYLSVLRVNFKHLKHVHFAMQKLHNNK
ncbi:CLUMA_CG000926, isoform A [Clunio marinus]|uniref:CLUMA_CG000926, isoform A n=1 Tax=Clunio marinus TaxID=568069 RepID=A0A1J1HGE8_9DIPT|nr:CLUMA_CG000926, isoform A [Clunio marinus]